MRLTEKIRNSWWAILSFVMFLNGLGFIYVGFKHDNKNWVLEGIAYEFPWFFYFVVYANYGPGVQSTSMIAIAVLLMLVSIIRSIWLAIKLVDVYENNEKYTIKQTNLNHETKNENRNGNSSLACCLCLLCIFIIFAIIIL